MPQIISIAVFKPLRNSFDYLVPMGVGVSEGDLVEVPFGKTVCKGVCLKKPIELTHKPKYQLKEILYVYPVDYRIPKDLMRLGHWLKDYYLTSIGEVFQTLSCSSPIKRVKESTILKSEIAESGPVLKQLQRDALKSIEAIDHCHPILLHGVTGSGKTEVYLRLIEKTLKKQRSCIYLLPEITLTRETMRKLYSRFSNILLFHSGMTAKERREAWLQSRQEGPYLIIGARSALFSPVQHLGLIIVDEEHDGSYKQDSHPRYHARDVAVVRAKQCSAMIVLGSATPSLESYQNALKGKYTLVQMLERVSAQKLPKVHVVNIVEEKRELRRAGHLHFSRQLISSAKRVLLRGKKVIFFLNRRGYSTIAFCPACGIKIECPQCSVSLTYYRSKEQLRCHHCDYQMNVPKKCPSCEHPQMVFKGTGTEKIHDLVEKTFPQYEIVRIDGTVDHQKNVQEKLAEFMSGKGDILLGTQMISKGLDSDQIQLSAALNADLGLSIPDFRSAERDFQLLTQLAGRSGRGEESGECIFQTYEPEHYAIRHAVNQNYEAFYNEEIVYRRQLGYPPYQRLARFVFSSSQERKIAESMRQYMPILRREAESLTISLLGPSPAPLQRVKNQYRWHLIAKSGSAVKMTTFLEWALSNLEQVKGIRVTLDRDPQNMM